MMEASPGVGWKGLRGARLLSVYAIEGFPEVAQEGGVQRERAFAAGLESLTGAAEDLEVVDDLAVELIAFGGHGVFLSGRGSRGAAGGGPHR